MATKKLKARKKASPAKKAPKGAKKGKGARDGSKTAKILDLLKRPGAATSKELQKGQRLAASFGARFLVGDRSRRTI